MMYIVTVDVGTSGTKTALWNERGDQLAQASQSYALRRPDPLTAEIDAELWWTAARDTIREVLERSRIDPQHVAGVGLDGIGWTLVPVDGALRALAPAMTWLDRRAGAEADRLRALPEAERLVDLAANPIDPAYITPKLAWLRERRPDVFEAACYFLTASGFLVAALTGEPTCDFTQAYGYHCFDIRRERWDTEAASAIGVPIQKLPPLRACGEIAGGITPEAAAEIGLRTGTPVIVGCLDAAAGALGAGVIRPGQTMDQGGQAGGMALSVDRVLVEPQLIFSHHVLPGQYLLQSGTVGGGSLGWFRDILGADAAGGAGAFEHFSREAAESAPGAGGLIFIPYMAGERTPLWNSNARGVFFGLSYAATRGDLLRAIMEGCAFAVYDNLKIAEEKGVAVQEWLGAGGATQSAVWCQIKADVTGRPFVIARRADGGEGGHGLGLFALASRAVGLCGDAGALVDRLLPRRQVFEPSAERHARYEELFAIYLDVSRKLLPDFDRLAAVARERADVFA